MKPLHLSFSTIASAAALSVALLPSSSLAQSTLVDFDQTWNFMHPTAGELPAGSGTTTPHPDGTTPWFASAVDFDATYTGPSFTTNGTGFEAGPGPGPLGYGTINHIADDDAEFTALGTTLTSPSSGDRHTAYFRTTFTVPDDGRFFINPIIRFLADDGAFIYLDGELILTTNVGAISPDDYLLIANTSSMTENDIRIAELDLPAGSSTGGNNELNPSVANNSTLIRNLSRLSPGTHTLAVSLHNASPTSSDFVLALQVLAEPVNCLLTGSASGTMRDFNNTLADPSDDTISTSVTVASEGTVAPTWEITGPAGSSLIGQTGAYNTPVTVSDIPIAEFVNGDLTIEITDSNDPTCITSATITPPRIIGFDSLNPTATPILTSGDFDVPGWTFDDTIPSLTMNAPGGDIPFTITSQEIDLSGQSADVQFTGTLTVLDTSSGNEESDSFVAFLILDGDTANPINLITRHDLIVPDGILTAGELAPNAGTFVKTLNHVIPASVNSARFTVQAINNSASENFIVSDLGVTAAPAELQAYNFPGVFNNQGTPDPGDDTFTSEFIITPVNLSASTGWTSDSTPADGLYTAASLANSVTFGPFRPFLSPFMVTLADSLDPTLNVTLPVSVELTQINVSDPTNITRVENGPGFADDTLTFDLTITGTNGGPGWRTTNPAVSPASGPFGVNTFTILAPLVQGDLTFEVFDISYPSVRAIATVPVPGRFVIGQSDLGGTLVNLDSDLTSAPSPLWVNDATARTLTLSADDENLAVVESETLDLTSQGEVFFSATLNTAETSTTSNFETEDRFKAELIYNVGGTSTTINLIAPFDTGDGSPSTTGTLSGANGPADGFLNGYLGRAGTDLADGTTIYASGTEDYDAHIERDEFNRSGITAAGAVNSFFNLSAAIPANADDVKLIITGQGPGGIESFTVSNVLFSTGAPADDTDGDDIPDDYEAANGLNPNDPTDRNTDLDSDGQSNFSEFLAGTAANNPSSLLRITSALITSTTANLTWTSVPGRDYQIDFSTNLINWTDIGFNINANPEPAAETSTGEFNLTNLGAPTRAFFRVRVVQ